MVDIKIGPIKLRRNVKQVTFNFGHSMRKTKDIGVMFMINTIDEDVLTIPIKKRLGIELLVAVIMNTLSNGIDEYHEIVCDLIGR